MSRAAEPRQPTLVDHRHREAARGFPGAPAARARQAARVSRQRGLGATTALRARSRGAPATAESRQRAPRSPRAQRALDRRVRRRARQGSDASSTPRLARRSCSRAVRPRRINLVAATLGRQREPRRRSPDHLARAPLEHRAVATDLRHDRRPARRGADHRCRRARSRRLPPFAVAAHEDRRAELRLERARYREPGRRARRRGAMASALWCSSTRLKPCRTCASTCARSTATSSRSRGTRCSDRPASACCTASASCSRPCRPTRAAAT